MDECQAVAVTDTSGTPRHIVQLLSVPVQCGGFGPAKWVLPARILVDWSRLSECSQGALHRAYF